LSTKIKIKLYENPSILHVIVIYRAQLFTCKSWLSYLGRLPISEQIWVWDNSPIPQTIDQSNIHYTHCPQNMGVSHPYNQASLWAKQHGFSFLVLMDQDSDFPTEAFEQYQSAIGQLKQNEIGCPVIYSGSVLISPFKIVKFKPTYWFEGPIKNIPLPSGYYSAINSGLLISTNIIEQAGGFDERLKLDWSDIELFMTLGPSFNLKMLPFTIQHQLSVHEKQTTAARLRRFPFYCHGARIVSEKHGGFIRLGYMTFREGVKQTVFNFNLKFVWIWVKHFIFTKPI